MFNLLAKLRASKARKAAKANADSAWRQAHAAYKSARNRGDTRDQCATAETLLAAQTERLKLEMGR